MPRLKEKLQSPAYQDNNIKTDFVVAAVTCIWNYFIVSLLYQW